MGKDHREWVYPLKARKRKKRDSPMEPPERKKALPASLLYPNKNHFGIPTTGTVRLPICTVKALRMW